MAVELSGMLAGIVVLATGAILTINLIRFRSSAATAAQMSEERRRIVNACLIMIGGAAALWAVMMTIYMWMFMVSEAPFARMLMRL